MSLNKLFSLPGTQFSLLLLLGEHVLIPQNQVKVLIPMNSFRKYLLSIY